VTMLKKECVVVTMLKKECVVVTMLKKECVVVTMLKECVVAQRRPQSPSESEHEESSGLCDAPLQKPVSWAHWPVSWVFAASTHPLLRHSRLALQAMPVPWAWTSSCISCSCCWCVLPWELLARQLPLVIQTWLVVVVQQCVKVVVCKWNSSLTLHRF
jgi:hypothetical protein